MTEYKIIPLGEDYRVRVEYDESPTCPRGEDYMITGALTVNGDSRRMDVPTVHDFPGGRLAEARETFMQGMNWNNAGVQQYDYDGITQRWARIFHDIHVELIDGTFWWCDPLELEGNWPWPTEEGKYKYRDELLSKVDLETKIIAQEHATYEQWADGQVYGVILEKKVRWVKVQEGDDDNEAEPIWEETRFDWEELESVWSIYIDDERDEDEQFIEYAKDLTGQNWYDENGKSLATIAIVENNTIINNEGDSK